MNRLRTCTLIALATALSVGSGCNSPNLPRFPEDSQDQEPNPGDEEETAFKANLFRIA